MSDNKEMCDPSRITVAYRGDNTPPTYHVGVKFVCLTDINGTYRRIDFEDLRKAFAEPLTAIKSLLSDPWIHRSEGMRCRTCMFYVRKTQQEGHKEVGRCRRHAPTMNGYPVVYVDDWCGDHKVDETKV